MVEVINKTSFHDMLKKGMKLNTRLLLLILSASALIYIAAIGYISLKAREIAYVDAKAIADTYVSNYASEIRNTLEKDLIYVKSLAQAFSEQYTKPKESREQLNAEYYQEIFKRNPQFFAVWDSWELSVIDPTWPLPYGRVVEEVFKIGRASCRERV